METIPQRQLVALPLKKYLHKKLFFLWKKGLENLTTLHARAIIIKIAGEVMMFAKKTQKIKNVGTDSCAMAEGKLNAAVRFSISQNYFIFCKKD